MEMEPKEHPVGVKFMPSQFVLPFFILSRNQIKQSKFEEFKNYITKKSASYNKYSAKDFENTTPQHLSHAAGKDCWPLVSENRNSSVAKKWIAKPTKKTWQLPPNLYDVAKIPYESKKGIGGAHWPRISTHETKSRPIVQQRQADFYNLSENEKLSTPCNRNKGRFLTNARERRPTTRCMINCVTTCYRNSSDPGPSTYRSAPTNKQFEKSVSLPNPHLFYNSSNVPQKENAIHSAHTSFAAAPGRYETRYPKSCSCPSRLIYYPQKVKLQNYTSHDWRHVKGRGFRYLFMGFKPQSSKHSATQSAKIQKSIKLYPDSKYIGIIDNPARTPLSFRLSPISSPEPRIRFNCFPKVITRRQLRSNKKTAFNSCRDRFPDNFRLPILTLKQREKLKQALPLERQLRNRPIMCKRLSEISSKLTEIPKHMLPNYVPALRKKMFKFQPLPQAKVLVTENESSAKVASSDSFFLRPLETKHFLKAGVNM